jgi:hypothetical protein
MLMEGVGQAHPSQTSGDLRANNEIIPDSKDKKSDCKCGNSARYILKIATQAATLPNSKNRFPEHDYRKDRR